MNDLLYKKLEDICLDEKRAIISGPFGSNISSKYFVDKGIPVIRGNNLSLSLDKFYDEGFVYVTKKKADELNCYAKKLDIIFTAAGTIGQVGLITNDTKYDCYVISNKQVRARLDPNKIDILYAYYWFTSPWIQKYLTSNNKGSTVPLLSLWEVKNLPIIYPKSMSKQKKISNIIDKISKKIELNNKINDELEVMAKTVYDYWFLQFEFPNEEGKPYKSSGGKMVWNEELKREIPEGWEVVNLSSCIKSINTGLNPRKNFKLNTGKFKYITVKNINIDGSIDFNNCDTIDIEALKLIQDRSKLSKGDILFASIAPLGRCYLLEETPTDWNINESVFSIRPNNNISSYLLYYYLVSDEFIKKATYSTVGSVFQGIRINTILNMKMLLPKKEIIHCFDSRISSLTLLKYKRLNENQELTKLRDFLLPLLMNGQVGFKEDKAEG